MADLKKIGDYLMLIQGILNIIAALIPIPYLSSGVFNIFTMLNLGIVNQVLTVLVGIYYILFFLGKDDMFFKLDKSTQFILLIVLWVFFGGILSLIAAILYFIS